MCGLKEQNLVIKTTLDHESKFINTIKITNTKW